MKPVVFAIKCLVNIIAATHTLQRILLGICGGKASENRWKTARLHIFVCMYEEGTFSRRKTRLRAFLFVASSMGSVIKRDIIALPCSGGSSCSCVKNKSLFMCNRLLFILNVLRARET